MLRPKDERDSAPSDTREFSGCVEVPKAVKDFDLKVTSQRNDSRSSSVITDGLDSEIDSIKPRDLEFEVYIEKMEKIFYQLQDECQRYNEFRSSVSRRESSFNQKQSTISENSYELDSPNVNLCDSSDTLKKSDPLWNLVPRIHAITLPNHMIGSDLSASELDQIYSSSTPSLDIKNSEYVHRHIINPQSENEIPLQLLNDEPLPAADDSTDQTDSSISSDSSIEEDSDLPDEEDELETSMRDEDQSHTSLVTQTITESPNCFLQPEPERKSWTKRIYHRSDKKKELLKDPTKCKLKLETYQAMQNEKERKERINKQENLYREILPTIEQDSNESRLILDIDIDTHFVRVEVVDKLVKYLKPHQREGIKFMYNSIIENVDRIEEPGSGCILAHDMGSGKSLQVIALVHTLLTNRYTKRCSSHIMVTAPSCKLRSWTDEFNKWIVKTELDHFAVHVISSGTDITQNFFCEWVEKGGVLIIAHKLFTGIAGGAAKVSSSISRKILVDPGPDLLIIDEAHYLDERNSKFYRAIATVPTKRKILITGTPLRNRMKDYYLLIDLLKPRLLGSFKEFKNRFGEPIEDQVVNDIQLLTQQANELRSLLSGSIQRFNQLELHLPSKYEFVIYIRPTKRISMMYNWYMDHISKGHLMQDFYTLNLCVNHPSLLRLRHEVRKWHKKEPYSGLDHKWYQQFDDSDEWASSELSGKFITLFKILESCIAVGDKLVVISQSRETIELIARVCELSLKWKLNKDYGRIDTDCNYRLKKKFHPEFIKTCKLVLMSSRSFGVDLTAANRVLLFDLSWNPIDDRQSISRVFRFGQTKPVYVYRFVTTDTMEEEILRVQGDKLRMMALVLDKKPEVTPFMLSSYNEFYRNRPKNEYDHRELTVENDCLLDNILGSDGGFVLNCVEVNSLLEPKLEQSPTECQQTIPTDHNLESRRSIQNLTNPNPSVDSTIPCSSTSKVVSKLKTDQENLSSPLASSSTRFNSPFPLVKSGIKRRSIIDIDELSELQAAKRKGKCVDRQ